MKASTVLIALCLSMLTLAACGKSNDAIVQDELNQSAHSCAQGCEQHVAGCDIKGNINSSGRRYYHVPGTKNYQAKVVDPARGERWFCTEQEARDNGYVRRDQ